MDIQHAATLNKYYDLTWEHIKREQELSSTWAKSLLYLGSTAMKMPSESWSLMKPQTNLCRKIKTKGVIEVARIKLQTFSCRYKSVNMPLQTLVNVFSAWPNGRNMSGRFSFLPRCSLNNVDIICARINQAAGGWASAWLLSGLLAAASVPIWLWLLLSHVRQVVVFCCSLMGTAWPVCCLPLKR